MAALEVLKDTYKKGVHMLLVNHRQAIGKLDSHQIEEFYDRVIAGSGCSYDLFVKVHLYGANRMNKTAFELKWLKSEFYLLLPSQVQARVNINAVTAVVKKNTVVQKRFDQLTREEAELVFDFDHPSRGELPPNQQTVRVRSPKYLAILNVLPHPDDPRFVVLECVAHNIRVVVRTTLKELQQIVKKLSAGGATCPKTTPRKKAPRKKAARKKAARKKGSASS